MPRPTVRIEVASSWVGTRVYLDGVEVTGLVNVVLEHRVDNWPKVTLEILPGKVELPEGFSGDVEVVEVTSHPSEFREYSARPKRDDGE